VHPKLLLRGYFDPHNTQRTATYQGAQFDKPKGAPVTLKLIHASKKINEQYVHLCTLFGKVKLQVVCVLSNRGT